MPPDGMQQMPGENHLQFWNTPGCRSHDRIIARDMGVNDVDVMLKNELPQPQCRYKIGGIAEGKREIGIQRTIRPARQQHLMSELPQLFSKFDNVSFAAAERMRGTNLQNAHFWNRSRTAVRNERRSLSRSCRPQFPQRDWPGSPLLPSTRRLHEPQRGWQ